LTTSGAKEDVAGAAPEVKLTLPTNETTTDSGNDSDASNTATAQHGKATLSKSHAIDPPVTTVDSEAAVDANEGSVHIDAIDAEQTPDAETTASASAKPAESPPKPEPQIVRNVTQLVAADGSVLATQTSETRVESTQATGHAEVVVVEKTTLQALPENTLRGVRYLTANGEQTMRIRLVPESLGEMRLEVTSAKGEVNVKLTSANAAVREILQTHAPGLQTAIAQDNAGTVRVTVTADVSSGAWLSGNAQRQNAQHDGSAQQRQPMSTWYHEPKHPVPAGNRRETAHAGNLNVYA
jgi:flagellar hook-length control protein FliK